MVTSVPHIVVVGASIAGARAAEAIRRQGFDGTLTVVGAEHHFPPIDRPPLSKRFLASELDTDADPLRIAPDLDLTLRLGRTAVGLDQAQHAVQLDDRSTLNYDGLVIATGSSVRRLPYGDGCMNVQVLRTAEDAVALRYMLQHGKRVAVIGAGVLGCEIAATCRSLDLDVALIDVFTEPMVRVLGTSVSRLVADLHASNGVRMLLGRRVLGFRDAPNVTGVVLDGDEVIDADVVVVAIGAYPETGWLRGSGVEVDDGVLCDESCFVPGSARTIVAAGDVARWHHRLLGRPIRVEHWTNAVSQGQAAGRNLVAALSGHEDPVPYDGLPYFWSDQYDWKLQFVGVLGEDAAIEEGSVSASRFVMSYRTHGQLVGALCVNWASRISSWRRQIVADVQSS
jgi:3-phenylpropionate/trans-cinnamate dioxygenase ferredoxin reductase component